MAQVFAFLLIAIFGLLDPAAAFAQPLQTASSGGALHWNDFYAGVHGGWERDVFDGATVGLAVDDTTRIISNGVTLGAQIGRNYQVDRFIFGWEFSGSWDGSDKTSNCFASTPDSHVVTHGGGAPGFSDKTYRCNIDPNWTLQGLARAGMTADGGKAFVYAIGGIAVSNFSLNYRYDSSDIAGGLSSLTYELHHQFGPGQQDLFGIVLGGGVQLALTDTVSLGLEYLHTEYDGGSTTKAGHFNSASNLFPPSSGNYTTSEEIDFEVRYDPRRAELPFFR